MTVELNGETVSLPAGTTLADLIAGRAGGSRGSAVAVDGNVVPRSAWAVTPVEPGQRIELITAVQGG